MHLKFYTIFFHGTQEPSSLRDLLNFTCTTYSIATFLIANNFILYSQLEMKTGPQLWLPKKKRHWWPIITTQERRPTSILSYRRSSTMPSQSSFKGSNLQKVFWLGFFKFKNAKELWWTSSLVDDWKNIPMCTFSLKRKLCKLLKISSSLEPPDSTGWRHRWVWNI